MSLEINEEQKHRFLVLETSLKDIGLSLRDDSDLCWNFILYGNQASVSDVDMITQMMAKAEYLHKYCDFQLGYNIAQNIAKKRAKSGQPPALQHQWVELVNSCVLQTTDLNAFPYTWPWLESISPEEWKRQHTLSQWQ